MSRKDLKAILVIGAGVGLLIQPILANNLPSYHLTLAIRIGIFVFFTLFAPLALWIAYLISKAWKSIYQFAEFAAVGRSTASSTSGCSILRHSFMVRR